MCTYISVRTWIQIIYFGISVGSTYCIYVDPRHYDLCIRVIVTMCYLDFVVDILGWSRMKNDMRIHHVFVCIFIGALSIYHAVPSLDSDARHVLMTAMLSTEISTMFLTIMPLFRIGSDAVVVRGLSILNQALFVASFVYYRLYHYTVYLLWNGAVHKYIYNEIFYMDHPVSTAVYCVVEMAIFGMWILNLYWLVYIVRKSLRRRDKIKNCRR